MPLCGCCWAAAGVLNRTFLQARAVGVDVVECDGVCMGWGRGGGQRRVQYLDLRASEHKDDIQRTHTVRRENRKEQHPHVCFRVI